MMAILYGLNFAIASFSCIFCHHDVHRDIEHNLLRNNIEKEIERTLAESTRITNSKTKEHKGYKKEPIVHIEFKNSVVDTLHLLMRITDKKIESLMDIIRRIDLKSNGSDLSERPMMKNFLDFLETTCEIVKPYYIKTRNKKAEDDCIELRTFTSNEIKKMLECISKTNFHTILCPNYSLEKNFDNELKKMTGVWKLFYKIYIAITKENEEENLTSEIDGLQKLVNDYHELIVRSKFNTIPNFTPYMHIITYHLTQLMKRHSNIHIFNLQGSIIYRAI